MYALLIFARAFSQVLVWNPRMHQKASGLGSDPQQGNETEGLLPSEESVGLLRLKGHEGVIFRYPPDVGAATAAFHINSCFSLVCLRHFVMLLVLPSMSAASASFCLLPTLLGCCCCCLLRVYSRRDLELLPLLGPSLCPTHTQTCARLLRLCLPFPMSAHRSTTPLSIVPLY